MKYTSKKQKSPEALLLDKIFNQLRSFKIEPSNLPKELDKRASKLFRVITKARVFKNSKVDEKKDFFKNLVRAGILASYHDGTVMYQRDYHKASRIELQVVDAVVELGYFENYKSRCKERMSRLVPTQKFREAMNADDPNEFDPQTENTYITLRDRKTKKEIFYDPEHQIAKLFQKKLEDINDANANHSFEYEKWCPWSKRMTGRWNILRPVHHAIFTDDFGKHGRLYTKKYGHQGLRRVERDTLIIDGQKTVEIDYVGFHPRMLYHLKGIRYTEDPYALWDDQTTKPERMMAKVLLNALINAKSDESAIDACNSRMSRKHKDGKTLKKGKAFTTAIELFEAAEKTGLKFKNILPRVKNRHKRISDYFNADMGIILMNYDAKMALEVLHHFADQEIPCLGCHDSFLIGEKHEEELRGIMSSIYKARFGFRPYLSGEV